MAGAEEMADRAEPGAEAAELRDYIGTVPAERAWVALHQGDLERARAETEAAMEEAILVGLCDSPE